MPKDPATNRHRLQEHAKEQFRRVPVVISALAISVWLLILLRRTRFLFQKFLFFHLFKYFDRRTTGKVNQWTGNEINAFEKEMKALTDDQLKMLAQAHQRQ